MGICYIIGAGECGGMDFIPTENDYIICADGGLDYAEKYGVAPDLAVGDFDSCISKNIQVDYIKLPREKDETDTLYAVNIGFNKGFTEFRLYGMLGGRIDHTLANLQLLKYIKDKGGNACLVGDDYDVYLIKNESISLSGEKGKYVSVFSNSAQSNGVAIKNLKYEVYDFMLSDGYPVGVSNEFTDNCATVSVEEGELIITVQK